MIRGRPSRVRRDGGFALVAVLSAALLLAVITQSFVNEVRTDANLARNLKDNGQARALADGAVFRAAEMLIRDRSRREIVPDGRLLSIDAAGETGATVTVAIQDESGKIDLNRATPELLQELFESVGMESDNVDDLADAIFDWRDRDDLRRANGAEGADYRRAGLPYGAKNRAFETVDELRLVMGMTPALFARVEPALTVYSGKRGVDPRVAPKPVLLALGLGGEKEVSAFLESRQQSGAGNRAAGIPGFDISPRFLTTSTNAIFHIRSTALLPSGALYVRDAVLRIAPNRTPPYTILHWRRGKLADGG